MGLFGTEMRDVMTPDGRRITVPAQLAQAFPALQPAPPLTPPPEVAQSPSLLPTPPVPAFTPQDQQDLAGTLPPMEQPVIKPSQATAQPALQPRGALTSPSQAVDAGPSNGPAPMTNDQLAQIGTAGAYNAAVTAQEGERAAVERLGDAQADQATKIGEVMQRADERAGQLLEARARAAEENAAALQAKTDEYNRNAKAVADTKIDRSANHPVLVALSQALLGLGQALDKKPIDVMTPVYKALDRKVDAQMQDLDRKRAALGLQRDALGLQREAGRDRLAEMDAIRLGYIDQAKRQVETIKQTTSSDVIRAGSDVALAQLDIKRSEVLGTAVQREQQKREAEAARKQSLMMHRESIGVQRRGQDMEQARFDAQLEQRRQEKIDEIAAHLLASGQKERAEKLKAVSANAVGDPTSGDDILQPEGQAKIKEATAAEKNSAKFAAAAAVEKNPDKKRALMTRADAEKQKAFDLRTEVASDPKMTWTVGDEKSRREIGTKIAMGQTIASTADEIKLLREQHGPKWLTTSEGQAFMQSKGTAVLMALKDAWGLGVLSKLDVELLNKATGGDPAKLTLGDVSNFLGAEGVASRLDGLVDTLEQGARNEMRALRFRGDFKFKRDRDERTPEEKATGDALKGATPLEAAEEHRNRRTVMGVVERAYEQAGAEGMPASQIEQSGSRKYPGLSKSQEPAVDLQLKAYKAGLSSEDEKAQKKGARSGELLVKLATDNKRPSLRDAMLTTLQANAPELYEQALAALPDDVRAARVRQPGPVKRGLESLSDDERTELERQKEERGEAARRDAYRSAYVKQAQRGALGAWKDRQSR